MIVLKLDNPLKDHIIFGIIAKPDQIKIFVNKKYDFVFKVLSSRFKSSLKDTECNKCEGKYSNIIILSKIEADFGIDDIKQTYNILKEHLPPELDKQCKNALINHVSSSWQSKEKSGHKSRRLNKPGF